MRPVTKSKPALLTSTVLEEPLARHKMSFS